MKPNEPCTVELIGGLGNQLFQIFNLLSYCLSHGKPFYLLNTPIKYGWRKNFYWDTPLLKGLKPYVLAAPHANIHNRIHRESHFHFAPIGRHDFTLFFGYYQSYKYFNAAQEVIYNIIGLKASQQEFKAKMSSADNTANTAYNYDWDNTISMHFRLGDYKPIQQTHPVLTADYYQAALEDLVHRTGRNDWTVLYFCEDEDIETVDQGIMKHLRQVPALTELKWVKINSQLKDWEQLLTMSLCRHHIIANSSFSWWGAYFSLHFITADPAKHGNKAIYYPERWFGPSKAGSRLEDMFPPSWIKIPHKPMKQNILRLTIPVGGQ